MATNRDYKKRATDGFTANNPMITGVVIGVLIGLGIALIVALYINAAPSPFRQATNPAASAKPPAKPSAQKADGKASGQPEKNRFTYYDILPGAEQPVTEQEIKQAPRGSKDQYFLQAGSFPNEADANNLKAKLALMGVEATIQTASVPDKGVWHRVRVGPFNDVEEMNRARANLAQNGLEASLIKVQEPRSAN